jgi:hypothetical protein
MTIMTEPLRITRRAHPTLNARSASPMRVPPPQSFAARDRRSTAPGGPLISRFAGHSGEASREQKALDASRALRQPADEVQQHPAVALHRTADVCQDDDRARLLLQIALRQIDELSTVLEAQSENAPEVDGPVRRRRPAARAANTQPPSEPAKQGCGARHLLRCEVRKVLGARHVDRAVRPDREADGTGRSRAEIFRLEADGHLRQGARREPWAFAEREQRQTAAAPAGRLPEQIECPIELRQIGMAVHEQRPHHCADVCWTTKADPFDRGYRIQHPAGVDVHACPPQHARKLQQVPDERAVAHGKSVA